VDSQAAYWSVMINGCGRTAGARARGTLHDSRTTSWHRWCASASTRRTLSGQRARRILESRAVDWAEGRTSSVLDESDLTAVEAGYAGMRGWTAAEERLAR
jgi:hypothetical protein